MPQSKSRRSHYRPLYSCKITKLKPILCHFRHALETSPILVKAKDGAAPAAAASWGHSRTIAALLLCCCHRFTWQLKSFSIPWCSPPRTKTSWWSTGSAEHLHGARHGAHGESSQKWFLVLRIILKKNVRCVQIMLPLPDDVNPIRTCDMNTLIEGDFSHVLMFNCSDYSVPMSSIPDHVLEKFILGIFLGFLLGVPSIFHVRSTYVPTDSFRTHLAICSSARQRSGPQASPPGTSIVLDRNTWRTLKHIEKYWNYGMNMRFFRTVPYDALWQTGWWQFWRWCKEYWRILGALWCSKGLPHVKPNERWESIQSYSSSFQVPFKFLNPSRRCHSYAIAAYSSHSPREFVLFSSMHFQLRFGEVATRVFDRFEVTCQATSHRLPSMTVDDCWHLLTYHALLLTGLGCDRVSNRQTHNRWLESCFSNIASMTLFCDIG